MYGKFSSSVLASKIRPKPLNSNDGIVEKLGRDMDMQRISGDADSTKRSILNAAEVAFASHGLKGARTEEIARGAGVATRMIYYYFGSKEGLYKAVLERPAAEFYDWVQQLDLEHLAPDEALAAMIRAGVLYEIAHRYRGMLLFHEANQNQGRYFGETGWRASYDLVKQLLKRGVEVGIFRELDLEMTNLLILSVCTFYASAHENLKHFLPGEDLMSTALVDRYIKAAVGLVLTGIGTDPAEQR